MIYLGIAFDVRLTHRAVAKGIDIEIRHRRTSADAFELFTGRTPSAAEMGIAFDDVMANGNSASHAA